MSIKSPGKRKPTAIRPARARYIKLGTAGEWEAECIEKGIIRFGFGSARPERFPLCCAGKWDQLTQSFIAGGRTRGTATRFTNETRHFFEDDGSTLWIRLSASACTGACLPQIHPNGIPTARPWPHLAIHAAEHEFPPPPQITSRSACHQMRVSHSPITALSQIDRP